MYHHEAVELIRAGVPHPGGTWADLGAGSGTFSRALAELLGPEGTVIAVDRDATPLPAAPVDGGAAVVGRRADFTGVLDLGPLDGIVMANALHYVRWQERALGRIVPLLRPGGSFVLVEYDTQRGSPWIPFPVPPAAFRRLAAGAGLETVIEIGRLPSRFGPRDLYAVHARARPEVGD